MIQVASEIGRLRRVLVHEPGKEVDVMVPSMMDELLFDDILFGDSAREEHGRFRRVMQVMGIEVVDAQELLTEALADSQARTDLTRILAEENLHDLSGYEAPEALAELSITGLRRAAGSQDDLFALPPVPNWCFQRDPQVVLYDGVVFGRMATQARRREALLSRLVFQHHRNLRGTPVRFDPRKAHGDINLEGGDVLVLSPNVVAVGISARSTQDGALALGRALSTMPDGPRWLVGVELPPRRAYMHLDTVMTPVDHDACLVFPPVILGSGRESAKVFLVDLQAENGEPQQKSSVLETLSELGLDYEPLPCGGEDLISQQREQWTDGANALAAAPGVFFLYRRNQSTADMLSRRGFRVIAAEDILLGREEINLDDKQRTCILISSHEISRARGGPHCLTHPLFRDQ